MTLVTERMYRNHVIYIVPSILGKDATGEATVSITNPDGEEWWECEAHGTEAGMFYHAEGVIDEELAPNDEDDLDDPDGPFAQQWRQKHGYQP